MMTAAITDTDSAIVMEVEASLKARNPCGVQTQPTESICCEISCWTGATSATCLAAFVLLRAQLSSPTSFNPPRFIQHPYCWLPWLERPSIHHQGFVAQARQGENPSVLTFLPGVDFTSFRSNTHERSQRKCAYQLVSSQMIFPTSHGRIPMQSPLRLML
jgi:hypothetical protein